LQPAKQMLLFQLVKSLLEHTNLLDCLSESHAIPCSSVLSTTSGSLTGPDPIIDKD